MSRASYLTDKAQVGEVPGKGLGLFAAKAIAAGETVAGFGGTVVDQREFDTLGELRRTHSIQIDEALYLVGDEELEPAHYVNHSCAPNVGIVGNVLLVAMRDIAPRPADRESVLMEGEEAAADGTEEETGGGHLDCEGRGEEQERRDEPRPVMDDPERRSRELRGEEETGAPERLPGHRRRHQRHRLADRRT